MVILFYFHNRLYACRFCNVRTTKPSKMMSRSINQRKVIGQNSCLIIAFAVGLHSDTRTREVCRADIGHLSIVNHHLGVDSWI